MPKRRIRSYKIAEVLKRRDLIFKDYEIREFLNTKITADNLDELVRLVSVHLPQNIKHAVLVDSLRELINTVFSETKLFNLAWRLAGNVSRLQSFAPVRAWSRQPADELVPVQIVAAERHVNAHRKTGAKFEYQILAGTSCPHVIEKFWTTKFCAFLATHLGFSKPWDHYPFQDVLQFVNLRMTVKIEPRLCGRTPGFEVIHTPLAPSIMTWNRTLLSMRQRLQPDKFVCPKNYPREHACHLCPIGLDECPAAVHESSYEKRFCSRCEKIGWFDTSKSTQRMCVDCYNLSHLKETE